MEDPCDPKHLKDIRDLDIVTTVELDNAGTEDDPVYHALYASQLYGTFFGVLGRFATAPIEGKDDMVNVTCLHLRILNLQGVLNIGFSSYDPSYEEISNDDGTKTRIINLGVRGASGIQSKTLKFNEDKPLQIKRGQRCRLQIERLLFPMAGVEIGGNLGHKLPTPNQADLYFDTEFHYRNGSDHFYQVERDGMSNKPDKADANPLKVLWPSGKCVPANIYLLYTGSK